MAREVPRAVVLNGSTLRPHKGEPTEFYPRRQTPSHPIIVHKFLGLWDSSNFCFMYNYVRPTTLARFVLIKTQYIQLTANLELLCHNLQDTSYVLAIKPEKKNRFLHLRDNNVHSLYRSCEQSTHSLLKRSDVATYPTNIHHHPLGNSLQCMYQ